MKSAAGRSGREAGGIILVVVSKNRTVEEVKAVLEAGVDQIGENRVLEAARKKSAIPERVTYRLIGHLQRNKARQAAALFDAIDSVDSLRIAKKLSEELQAAGKTMPVLMEVNCSGEETKNGFGPGEAEKALIEMEELPGLEIKGLMTIGPLTDDAGTARRVFAGARELHENLHKGRKGFNVLSMGMTDDFEIAIEEGSTMVRVGRAVFGKGVNI